MVDYLSSPATVEIEINQECNFSCPHCFLANAPELRLSFGDFEEIIRQLRLNNVFSLAITGGEPLVHPDLFKMIESASENSLDPLLATNGYLLTSEVAARLKECGLCSVQISLDNPDSASHDQFRRFPGAFDGVMRAARACLDSRIHVSFVTIMTSLNAASVPKITEVAGNAGVKTQRIIPFIPWHFAGESNAKLMPGGEQVKAALQESTKLARSLGVTLSSCHPGFNCLLGSGELFDCPAGTSACAFTSRKGVKPCSAFPIQAGSLRESTLTEVWSSSPVFEELRKTNNGGCRALGLTCSGSLTGPDPIFEALV